MVKSTITTRRIHHVFSKSDWHGSRDNVGVDSECLQSNDWNVLPGPPTDDEIRRAAPVHLFPIARDLIREYVREPFQSVRDTGIRLEVKASYSYRVSIAHQNMPGEILVSGLSNQVSPITLPPRSKNLTRRVARAVNSAFSAIGLSAEPKPKRQYLEQLRGNEAHLSDKRLLGPKIRKLGVQVVVTPQGYDVFPSLPQAIDIVSVTITTELGKPAVVQASVPLCNATPELYPKALVLNGQLEIGFIALMDTEVVSQKQFILVDRRSYEHAVPSSYLAILKAMSLTANSILEKGHLK